MKVELHKQLKQLQGFELALLMSRDPSRFILSPHLSDVNTVPQELQIPFQGNIFLSLWSALYEIFLIFQWLIHKMNCTFFFKIVRVCYTKCWLHANIIKRIVICSGAALGECYSRIKDQKRWGGAGSAFAQLHLELFLKKNSVQTFVFYIDWMYIAEAIVTA